MNTSELHSEYITGKRIDVSYGKYRLSSKIGSYCIFGYDQVSNQRHHHDCYELCLVLSGKGNYYCCDEVYPLSEGDIIIAPPDVLHEIQSSPKDNLTLLYIFITISKNVRSPGFGTFGESCIENFLKGHKRHHNQPRLISYIEFIESYNKPQKKVNHGTSIALENLILESLMELSLKSGSDKENPVKNIVENALDYIDANLHTRIKVSDIAANACTTVRNLEYIFKKQIGKTAVGYVNDKKTELACHYLSMYFNISDTAEMVGISNVAQFSVMFKKHKGQSPRDYQASLSGDKKGMGRRL